ncbi:MAG TPA: outer membrane protein assembly factor BamD [Candidatus Limnocylindrales bacterium]|nr:outer membrane protein assembly factor BamD [Candidatus Limnocylindrales bacterium]
MTKIASLLRTGLVLLATAGTLSACGAGPVRPEDELYREASLAFEEESYNSAIEDYKKMLEEYPFSDKAETAGFNIAYAYYVTEKYPEAIEAFSDFERLYPVSPLLPFVSYTIGMCYLGQAKSDDRDPSASEAALRQFERMAQQFPKSIYADLARYRAHEARENLALHELVVGDFYREKQRHDAAAARYRYVLTHYPTTEAAARANQRLGELSANPPAQAAGDASKGS